MIISDATVDSDFSQFEFFNEPQLLRRQAIYSELALKSVESIESIYIAYAQFVAAIAALERIYTQASRGPDLPYGLCLHGPNLTGKWTAVEYFFKSHVSRELFSVKQHEIIMIRAIRSARAEPLLSALLRRYGYPIKVIGPGSIEARINVVLAAARQKKTKVICIRNADNFLSTGRADRGSTSSATDILTQLMDEGKLCVVLTGSDKLLALKDVDSTFASRIQTYERLDNFSALTPWLEFVKAFFEKCVRFDFGFFWTEGQPESLYATVRGNPGLFKLFIVECALCAAERGSREITLEDVKKGFRALFGGSTSVVNPYENAR